MRECPDGRGDSAMKMAGALHPPFSLFLPEEKEKTGRARSKREKEVIGDAYGWTRDAQAVLPVSRMPSARGSVLAGVWISTNGPAALSAAAGAVLTCGGLSSWSGQSSRVFLPPVGADLCVRPLLCRWPGGDLWGLISWPESLQPPSPVLRPPQKINCEPSEAVRS